MMIRVLTAILCLSSTVVAQDYQQMVPVQQYQPQWRPAQQFVNQPQPTAVYQPQTQFLTPSLERQWTPNISTQVQVQSSQLQVPQVHYHYYMPQQPRCQQYQQPVYYQQPSCTQYYQQPCWSNFFGNF